MRIGRSMFVWCLIEEIQKLSLKIITLDLQTEGAETVKGVRVSITGVCQVKVNAYRIDEKGERVLNVNNLGLATQNFLGYDDREVADMIRKTLEGHQRQILGTLTVEEIYKDRAAFGTSVRTHMTPDLEGMGFELVSYVVASISDSDDYMYSLGQTQTAIVKREAQEGTAKNESEAAKKVSQYTAEAKVAEATASREAFVNKRKQEELEASASKDLAVARAKGEALVQLEDAKAKNAFALESAVLGQKVIKEQTRQKVEEATIMLEVIELKMQSEIREKEGHSQAKLAEERNNAESLIVMATAKREVEANSIRMKGEAEALVVKQTGEAQASVIKQTGEAEAAVMSAKLNAEAEGLQKRATAFKEYGEAAIVQSIVDRLPEIVAAMTKPLENTEKMVFITDDGSTASKFTGDINKMLTSLPETVKTLTGIDLQDSIKNIGGVQRDK